MMNAQLKSYSMDILNLGQMTLKKHCTFFSV